MLNSAANRATGLTQCETYIALMLPLNGHGMRGWRHKKRRLTENARADLLPPI